MSQQIARGSSEPRAGLVVIQQLVEDRLRKVQVLSGIDGCLARLVEIKPAAVHREPQRQRTIKHIRFSKAEQQHAGETANIGLYLQRFAQAKEVVCFIIQANERAFQSAHTARKTNAVFPFLMYLHRQINRAILLVKLAFSVVFGFQRVEIVQLVQAKHADVPQAAVKNLAFLYQQFTADNAVTRCSVSLELDPADKIRLALFHFNIQGNHLFLIVNFSRRNRRKVNVAKLAVRLAQVIQSLAHQLLVEGLSVLDGKNATQQLLVEDGFVVRKIDRLELVLIAFLDWHGDVHHLALSLLD